MILAIDDNHESLQLWTQALTGLGFEVRSANSGELALEMVAAQLPELILLKLQLSGMGGLEVLQRLKAHRQSRDIPVLLLSEVAEIEQRLEGYKLGAVDYLPKPFHLEELQLRVRTQLELYRLRSQNVAEKERNEEKVRAQAELLDLAQDAISVRDMRGIIQYWNKGSERLTGWTAAEAVGHPIYELLRPDPSDFERSRKALLEAGHWSGETTIHHRDGQILTAMTRRTLVRDAQGQPKAVLAINTDITEQKKLQAQFLRAQRLEAIGSLASGIAHDLNNILAPVLMSTPMLRRATSDPESHEILDTIEACVKRGADVIKQLLTYARGKPEVRVQLSLQHLLGEMEKIIHETFPRDIRLAIDPPEDLWPVVGDATQLQQVLMNLCVNARDAMPDGGKLELGARNVSAEEAMSSLAAEATPAPYVCIWVSDTGGGISQENLHRIFDPFFTTKEVGKGTGLGLSTAMGIVRGHGGFIQVESHPDRGTTFELYFPANSMAMGADLNVNAGSIPQGHGELILVVDDEQALRVGVGRLLERNGYRTVLASQGVEGLALFVRHRTDIRAVLTDMMMSEMNGPQMIATLWAIHPKLVVLGMSGLAERSAIKGLENLSPPIPMLLKPFTEEELLRALQAALQQSEVK